MSHGDADDEVVSCRGLVRSFGPRRAVDDVSFRIRRGETYGLLGPNGSGKTTTISLLSGILHADEGEVRVLGRPLTTRSVEEKRHLGLVPQEIALYQDLSPRENLRFFGRLQGMDRHRLDARIGEVLDVVGLADRADDRVDTFSGGMKRRVNIAAGLLHEPSLLVLDEPTVGVDPQSRNQILESVERLGGAGLSVLYTTHYMEEAERLCDRIGILDGGRLIAEGTRSELVSTIGEGDLIIVDGDHPPEVVDAVRSLPGVADVTVTGRGMEVSAPSGPAVLATVVSTLADRGVDLTGLTLREPNLEAVFLALTGRALRDGGDPPS